MINKIFKIASLALLLTPSIAISAPIHTGWYAGGSISNQASSYRENLIFDLPAPSGAFATVYLEDVEHNDYLLNGFVGYRWQNIGVEYGNYVLPKKNRNINIKSYEIDSARLQEQRAGFYLDNLYYYPIFTDVELKAYVGLGVVYSNIKSDISYSYFDLSSRSKFNGAASNTQTSAGIGMRAGIGAESNFTDNVSTSVMFKYQQGNKIVRSVQAISLDIIYYFS